MTTYNDIADRRARKFRRGMIFNGIVELLLGGTIFIASTGEMSGTLRISLVAEGTLAIILGSWIIRRYVIQGNSGHDDLKV